MWCSAKQLLSDNPDVQFVKNLCWDVCPPKKYWFLNIYDNFFPYIFKGKINNFSCLLLAGFDSLMSSYRLSDLALLYQLFSRVKKGQDELCTAFNEYIRVIISFRLKCWLILLINVLFFCNELCSKINIYQPLHVLRQP